MDSFDDPPRDFPSGWPALRCPATLVFALCLCMFLSGCGGGGGGSQPLLANQLAVSFLSASGAINIPIVSVTVCFSTSSCQTIDNVLVDTGSYGLRLASSALSIPVSYETQSGYTVWECAQFGSGDAWGPVAPLSVTLAGLTTTSQVPVQVVVGASASNTPVTSGCYGSSSDVMSGGINGILGVGLSVYDGGEYDLCTSSSTSSSCPTVNASLPLSKTVYDPVAVFSSDNNGVSLSFPSVPSGGSSSVSGILSFGVGTQPDNSPGSSVSFYGAPDFCIATTFNGTTYGSYSPTCPSSSMSFLDSGSNGLFFPDSSIPLCSGNSWYCPTSTLNLNASISGSNGSGGANTATIAFYIANADTAYFQYGVLAAPDLGASTSGMFDWGLPFFFGRTVYVVFDGYSSPLGTGPAWEF